MKVIGIDPGSRKTGYAVVVRKSGRMHLLDAGTIKTNPKKSIPERLNTIYSELREIIKANDPDAAAIESIFHHNNVQSALKLGQARGVALLALAQNDLSIGEYPPTTVKKTIGGHGHAGKAEMIRLVSRLLGLSTDLQEDAADAAAIAMAHIALHRFQNQAQL